MIHPSYTELLEKVNCDVEEGDAPVVNSRFSIVMATSKRARQIIAGRADVTDAEAKKPLSTAVKELYNGTLQILPEEEGDDEIINDLHLMDSDIAINLDTDEADEESDLLSDEDEEEEDDLSEESDD